MDFLRRHMFFIICGVVAASGLALGGLGLQGMPKVREEIKNVGRLYNELNSLSSSPVNLARIEAENDRIDKIKDDREKVFDKARSLYGYDRLVESVFPNGENADRIRFRRVYTQAMDDLFNMLQSGSPATRMEIKNWNDTIADERAEMIANGEDPDETTEPEKTPAGVLTLSGAKRNAEARANLAAAQRMRCYAVHFADEKPSMRNSSLEFSDAMKGTGAGDELYLDEVWWAQVGYWIQKDVIEAITAINDEAAVEASKAGIESSVNVMPVKDVISIRLSDGYIPRDGEEYFGDSPGGYAPARPVGTPETVFTHSGSTDWYEVVQFTIKLVMDQRDIPRLVNRLSKDRFHVLLRVAYKVVPPNRRMIGKIYGAEPVVNVVLDFETTMLGEEFRKWMPQDTCEMFEIDCPELEDEEGDG
ncbi:MAG: hypothetical protein IH989_05730 [Planctomycetes bacterium]|nr:hypothetical protein [Planctomycetota bacterium]